MVWSKEKNTDIISRLHLPFLHYYTANGHWTQQQCWSLGDAHFFKAFYRYTEGSPWTLLDLLIYQDLMELFCVSHLGLNRLEAEHEESTEHVTVWIPNLSLYLSPQCEERLTHMDASPSSLGNGTWNPGTHTPYKNFSSSFPPSTSPSFSLSLWKQTNVTEVQIITKKMVCVLRGTNPEGPCLHRKSKVPVP